MNNCSDSRPGSYRGSLGTACSQHLPLVVFWVPSPGCSQSAPCPRSSPGEWWGTGLEKGLRRNIGKKLLEGSCRSNLAGVAGRGQPPGPRGGVSASGELGGWQQDSCFICSLLIMCSVPGRNCCVLSTPVESASLQLLTTVDAPRDLVAASKFVPEYQRLIFEPHPYAPTTFPRRGDQNLRVSLAVWLRGWGSEWRGLQTLAVHGFFL
jgi:hypothetical protein